MHAQVDWLWAFPALGMLAFALLGIAARLREDDPPEPRRVRRICHRESQPIPRVALPAPKGARELNPRQPVIRDTMRAVRRHSRIDPNSRSPSSTAGVTRRLIRSVPE